MSEEQKRLLEKQLWGVANVLRGKMNADEYKNYILGFIFYKYLSEKLESYVNEKLLANEKFTFAEVKENTKEGKEYLRHIKTACLGHLGYFLKPSELFSYLVEKGKGGKKDQSAFILEDLKNILNDIEKTSSGTASEDDFKGLFDDMDLTSTKLGSRESEKNEVVVEVLKLLNGIDFKLKDAKSDLLGDAYEYLIGLPSNLFYGTSIPATVLVFKKCRREDEDILFIDASKEFEKEKNQNKLTDENIAKIFETYKGRKEIEKYSHKASLEEVKENEYNLNIPRYVDTFEEEEIVDIEEVSQNLKKLNTDEIELQNKIAGFCEELGINKPF